MLSAPNVTSVNHQPAQKVGVEQPETGGFDFLDYLLGLQANLDETPAEGPSALLSSLTAEAKEGETQESSDTKKDLSQWNSLFPGLGLANSTTPAQSGEKGSRGVGELDLSAKASLLAL